MGHLIFDCSEISRLVSDSMDRKLSFYQRLGIRIHLMMCRYCARYRKQLFFLRKTIRFHSAMAVDEKPSTDLSDESRNRIKRAIQNHLK